MRRCARCGQFIAERWLSLAVGFNPRKGGYVFASRQRRLNRGLPHLEYLNRRDATILPILILTVG